MLKHRKLRSGYALIFAFMILLIMTFGAVAFLGKSNMVSDLTRSKQNATSVHFAVAGAYRNALDKMKRSVVYNSDSGSGMFLNGRLKYVGGPIQETFTEISGVYSTAPANLLKHLIEQQAFTPAGVRNAAHEFKDFGTAFPTLWTPIGNGAEIRYTFTALSPDITNNMLTNYEYEYSASVRSSNGSIASENIQDAGVISVLVQSAPFSQYVYFSNSMVDSVGNMNCFAGPSTGPQLKIPGPFHINLAPRFCGRPKFTDSFTSATPTASWVMSSFAGYTGPPSFAGGQQGGIPTIVMPSLIYNTTRLAAGDHSLNAATDDSPVSNQDLRTFLAHHATGTLPISTASLPEEIYIPMDPITHSSTGGIYVEGNARISMNVVRGVSDFNSTQWSQLVAGDKSCKFQKISIQHLTSGISARDVYVGASPCDVTYVFDATTPSNSPVVLNHAFNGSIHVNGKIDRLGGESRTRPAIATDFGITVSALKAIRIYNDLQYEDAEYVHYNSDGTAGTTVLATPTGEVNGSGILPTNGTITPRISSASRTVLGIMSTQSSVMLHGSAPNHLNVHASVYVGNSNAYNATTELGCGPSARPGCGYGAESYTTRTATTIKSLGGTAVYRSFAKAQVVMSTGAVTGYEDIGLFDRRLINSVSPPGFPLTGRPQVYGTIRPFKTWRISAAGN